MRTILSFPFLSLIFSLLIISAPAFSQEKGSKALDDTVKKFLDSHRGKWNDLNVPAADGKTLYDLIIKHGYKNALELGTSTGHSAIWIAWALSKTGGKLTTIEIDPGRHKTAVENFKEAGLDKYIDARLEDAHIAVTELKGPFDFIFSDADKEWYTKYLEILSPKLTTGGCFVAHNVSNMGMPGIQEFLKYLETRTDLETTYDTQTGSGLSISIKK
jgi:caffeoyl-CoA O-methyltransferase